MDDFYHQVLEAFRKNTDPDKAREMKSYMRDQFEYFGIMAPKRKEITKPFLQKKSLPPIDVVNLTVEKIWGQPYREFYYFGIELLQKGKDKVSEKQIRFYEWLITHHSWWDTVDLIASNLVGPYFLKFPYKKNEIIDEWLQSGDIWLQRTAILFQLKYRDKIDLDTLEKPILYCKNSNEFFLQKAIGWALRQHGKIAPDYVRNFIQTHPDLSHLSKSEALKKIS